MPLRPAILLTGASGLLGRYVLSSLRDAGYPVRTVNRSRAVDARTTLADLADAEAVARLPTDMECIIHLAAFIPPVEQHADPDLVFRSNTQATLNLLEFAARHGVQNFIYGSSCAVYGDSPRGNPVCENEVKAPSNPYGLSKLAGEILSFPYAFFHGMTIKILRFSYLYGIGMRRSTAICTFIDLARQNRDISLFNGGEDRLDLLYAKDAAVAVLNAIPADSGIYNVGSGTTASVRDIADTVLRLTTSSSRLVPVPHASARRSAYMSIDKAASGLGWRPRFSLQTGLQDFLQGYV